MISKEHPLAMKLLSLSKYNLGTYCLMPRVLARQQFHVVHANRVLFMCTVFNAIIVDVIQKLIWKRFDENIEVLALNTSFGGKIIIKFYLLNCILYG